MVETYMRQSALAHLGLNARPDLEGPCGVQLGEIAFPGQIGLRLDASDEAILKAAQTALGFPLPVEANAATNKGATTALWLGPDEWLVLTPDAKADTLQLALKKALQDHHAAVFDVSDSRVVLSLGGENARDVLKKGCGLDLHPRSFGPGQCAQSTLALAHVLIHQTAINKKTGAATYHVIVHRSFAEYMWAWLEDAAGEYGVQVGSG
jgi:sarcosine oxidase, subunit gamma